MTDSACVELLQWALPRRRLRWAGFRKVRRQVCKRLLRRCQALELPDLAAYRPYLESHPAEWDHFDSFCCISISRFYRDRAVFDRLAQTVLPALASATGAEKGLHCWSLGCASGEEPYTVQLIWRLALQADFPGLPCSILATDADERLLDRARTACYPASSLKELPQVWRSQAFQPLADQFCLRPQFRTGITFEQQEIRSTRPAGPFDLILCRNLVLTYFELALQREIMPQLLHCLRPGGALVIGKHERLPEGLPALSPWSPQLGIYRHRPEQPQTEE